MPSLADHHSSKIVKLLYIGDSSSGKTGSLTSLVAAGYKLRILDLDNGLDPLVQFIRRDCPDKLGNVEYETLRDKYTVSGPKGQPKTYVESVKLLEKWSDGSVPAEWGEGTILVIDSLSALGTAAYNWAYSLNPGAKDPRQWYFAAQKSMEHLISMLAGEDFNTNLILISHVNYKETQDGVTKGYPNTVGSALGTLLPRYFNTLLLAETSGSGQNVKRKIKTMPTGVIDLKNPAPFKIEKEYPLEIGLASIFKTLKENSNA